MVRFLWWNLTRSNIDEMNVYKSICTVWFGSMDQEEEKKMFIEPRNSVLAVKKRRWRGRKMERGKKYSWTHLLFYFHVYAYVLLFYLPRRETFFGKGVTYVLQLHVMCNLTTSWEKGIIFTLFTLLYFPQYFQHPL